MDMAVKGFIVDENGVLKSRTENMKRQILELSSGLRIIFLIAF